MNKIDLHLHTNRSDGLLDPDKLAKLCADERIGLASCTDHDCIDGLELFNQTAQRSGIKVINGLEFSIEWDKGSCHLLAYGFDRQHTELNETLNKRILQRRNRIEDIVSFLSQEGYPVSMEEVEACSPHGVIGKPHIAQVLVNKGVCPTVHSCFDDVLSSKRIPHGNDKKISLNEAICLTIDAGGIPILAHPGSLGHSSAEDLIETITRILDTGVQGIEIFSEMHDDLLVAMLLGRFRDSHIYITGGSDFHGNHDESPGCYGDKRLIHEQFLRLPEIMLI